MNEYFKLVAAVLVLGGVATIGHVHGMKSAPTAGVITKLDSVRNSGGQLKLGMVLSNTTGQTLNIQMARDNDQDCTFGPSLRILEVGTRKIIYPQKGEPMLCPQDIKTETIKAASKITINRSLDTILPAGEYMVESWVKGLVNDKEVKLRAKPKRISVK